LVHRLLEEEMMMTRKIKLSD